MYKCWNKIALKKGGQNSPIYKGWKPCKLSMVFTPDCSQLSHVSYVIEVMNKFVFLHFRIVQRIKDGRCMASRANTIRAKEEFILLLLNIQLFNYFNHGKIETISNSVGLVNNFMLVGILSFMNLAQYWWMWLVLGMETLGLVFIIINFLVVWS